MIDQTQNVLIIGFGAMGKIHAKKIDQQPPFKVVAVIDNNEARLEEARQAGYATYTDLSSAYAKHQNFDVVVLTTNTETHANYIEQILAISAPALFVEKPIVVTKEQAARIKNLLIEHNYPSQQPLMCGYLLRESPAVDRLLEKITADGETIQSIEVRWQKQRKPDRASAGVIQDEATHSLDLIQYMLHRLDIKSAAHDLNIINAHRTRDIVNTAEQDAIYAEDDPNRDPFAEINYTLKFGEVAVTALSSFMRGPQERNISVVGNNKTYKLVFDDKGLDWCDDESFKVDKIACLWKTFAAAVQGKEPSHITTIAEAVNDVILTGELEEEANKFLHTARQKPTYS